MRQQWQVRTVLTGLLALTWCSPALAQNSDLGFLFGVTRRDFPVGVNTISSAVRVSGQFNYAWQLHEGPAGRFYIEAPLLVTSNSRADVAPLAAGQSGASYFITPGVRYHRNLTPRLAAYGAAGVGAAIRNERVALVSRQSESAYNRTFAAAAGDIGGGLDFRLTRLWSLRGEVRDFITSSSAGLSRRNNLAVQFGFALHF